MTVVATAGHVDHGKSSLVRALTGTDPDRFIEERQRGLTIDLGFAHTTLDSGRVLSFIDVPGHVRFLRNMLAGVGSGGSQSGDGVAMCVFVVAATEGWKPQSEEHLRILEMMGITEAVVALTKVDLVDDEWRELATMEVGEHLADSPLAGAPVVAVSTVTGEGIDDLRAGIDDTLGRLEADGPAGAGQRRARLWIDRVFTARGAGTVVTGTLTGNSLGVDQRVRIEPSGRAARIRGIQTLGAAVSEVAPGSRVALNLSGVDHRDLQRGDAVVLDEQWSPTAVVDAELRVLGDLDHQVSRRGAYLAYFGSREVPVKLRVLGTESLSPGTVGAVRLRLPVALALAPSDRFVLRETGRDETVGGGEILDIDPVLPASRARPDRRPARVVAERGWVTLADLGQLVGPEVVAAAIDRSETTGDVGDVGDAGDAEEPLAGVVISGDWAIDAHVHRAERAAVLEALDDDQRLGLDVAVLDERQRVLLDELVRSAEVTVDAGRARRVGASDPWAAHPVLEVLRAGGVAPVDSAALEIDRAGLRELIRRGHLIESDGIVFHPVALEIAGAAVRALLDEHSDGFSVSQLRERLAITRKHAVPLAQALDARGLTRRRGDLRIAGPALTPSAQS